MLFCSHRGAEGKQSVGKEMPSDDSLIRLKAVLCLKDQQIKRLSSILSCSAGAVCSYLLHGLIGPMAEDKDNGG